MKKHLLEVLDTALVYVSTPVTLVVQSSALIDDAGRARENNTQESLSLCLLIIVCLCPFLFESHFCWI